MIAARRSLPWLLIVLALASGCRSVRVQTREVDLSGKRPVFRWKRTPMAMSYHLQVATGQNFDELEVDEPGLTTESFEVLSPLPTDQELFWRVKASDSLLLPNPWSVMKHFRILSPPRTLQPKGVTSGRLPEFRWEYEGPEDISFLLQVSASPDFSVPLVEPVVKKKRYTYPVTLEYGRRYWWRVKARTEKQEGKWSEVVPFDLRPSGPALEAPKGPVTGPEAVLRWKRVPGAEAYVVHLAEDPSFDTAVLHGRTGANQLDASEQVAFEKPYFWRVAAVARNQPGLWSETAEFTMTYPVPEPKRPGKNIVFAQTPRFAWTPCLGAVAYEILLRPAAEPERDTLPPRENGEAGEQEKPLKGTRVVPVQLEHIPLGPGQDGVILAWFRPQRNLDMGVVYAWKVRALFAGGGRSDWSETSSFTVATVREDLQAAVQLTSNRFVNEVQPRVSPDGRRVCFTTYRFSYDPASGEPVPMPGVNGRTGPEMRVRWKTLSFTGDGKPSLGFDTSSFPSAGRGTVDRYPVWGPGDTLIFASDCLRTEKAGTDLVLKDLGRPGITLLTDGSPWKTYEDPAMDEGGKMVCYTVFSRNDRPTIWVMDLHGQAVTELVHGEHPSFSPDGRFVAYSSRKGGAENIWMVDRHGGTPRRLTDNNHPEILCRRPRFSHDGTRIAYMCNKRKNRDIWVLDLGNPENKKRKKRVTESIADDDYPDWLPGDNSLIFQSRRGSEGDWNLWAILLETENAETED